MSLEFAILTDLAKPTIPGMFSVPLLNLNSCPPPCIKGDILIPSFTYKQPQPFGP